MKVGITGSLASGKTTASKILSAGRGPLFSADAVVKKLYSKNDHRNRWSKQQINKWIEGVREIKLSLQEKRNTENLATRFVNSYKFISTSLIGVQSEQELKYNINKDNFIPLSRNKLKKIKLINKKNFFLNRLSPNRIT